MIRHIPDIRVIPRQVPKKAKKNNLRIPIHISQKLVLCQEQFQVIRHFHMQAQFLIQRRKQLTNQSPRHQQCRRTRTQEFA